MAKANTVEGTINTDLNDDTSDETGEETLLDESGEIIEEDELVVTIEGEEPPSSEETNAPEWVKEVRKSNRELLKRNRELEEKLNTSAPVVEKPQDIGKEPTLEDCEYDTEIFKTKFQEWHNKKLKADSEVQRKKDEENAASKVWQDTLKAYKDDSAKLKVKDFEESEDTVKSILSVTQQGIIVQGSPKAALIIYALGKNPKKAKELASIKDPVKFAFAVAELGTMLKTNQRKTTPAPERQLNGGNRSTSGAVDSTLERLRADAAKSGDLSKVVAYRNQQRAKAKQ